MTTDLLILGAGPAGCAAAITALRSGLRVIVLEAKPLAPRLPGETLHPGVEPILRLLGAWEEFPECTTHRPRGLWREASDGSRVFWEYGRDAQGPWLGFQVERVAFGRLLRSKVEQLGGVIVRAQGASVRWHTLTGEMELVSKGATFRAPMVLDGTGRHAWLAHALGLKATFSGPERQVNFGWRSCSTDRCFDDPVFKLREDGWDREAPLGRGQSAWVRLRFSRQGDPGGGFDMRPRIFKDCAGPGYMLLGDAAFLLDPSAANGVLRALMSGIYAATLVTAGKCGQISPSDAALDYRAWICRMYEQSAGAVSFDRRGSSVS